MEIQKKDNPVKLFFFFNIGFILEKMFSADCVWLVCQKKNMNSCRFNNTKD